MSNNDQAPSTRGLPLLMRVREVCHELGCSRSYVYVLMARRELAFVQVGRMRRVTRDSLAKYLARHTRSEKPE